MRLFLLECKLLGKHKLYGLFLLAFLLLSYVTIQPFSLGNNFAPMDASHIWVRMLLEDSEQEKLKNEYMELELEAYRENIEQLQLAKAASKGLTMEAIVSFDEQIRDLEEKCTFLLENMVILLTQEQKEMLEENAQEVLQAIGDGNYTKQQVLAMDTAVFQQVPIALSKQELHGILDKVDAQLGNMSHFAKKSPPSGENYRKESVEIGGYNHNLAFLYKEDGSSQKLTHEEMIANYEKQLEANSYFSMFTPFLCDKLAFILCLAMAFILAIFPLQNQGCTQDVIAMKPVSALTYIKNKYFSVVCMTFLPCLVFGLAMDVKLCVQAISFGYTVSPFMIPAAICVVLLPEILFLTGIGILASLLVNSVIVPFLLEAIFFGISVEDFFGNYGFNRPLIRFNLKGNTQLIDYYLQDIIANRLFFVILSGVVFMVAVRVYYMQKYGNLSKIFGMSQGKRRFIYAWINEIKMQLEEIQQKRKLRKFGRNARIYQYLFQLGYGKGIMYCIILDIAAMVLVGEMGGYHLFQRFLPLNGIILFSCIGFAEQEGNCKEMLLMKDRIHIRLLQFAVSTLISLIFVWGIGKFVLTNSSSTCIFISLFTLGLGCVYSLISRRRYGVVGGTFSAVMIYIFAAVTIL